MLFLSDIETIKRFENNDKFAGIIGIVPDHYSSGDNVQIGEITHRSKKHFLQHELLCPLWFVFKFGKVALPNE